MTIFKKQFIDGSRYNSWFEPFAGSIAELEAPVNTINISVTTDSDSIFLVVTKEEDNSKILNFEIPYDIITQSSAFGDQTLWAIKDSCINNKKFSSFDGEQYVLTEQDIINVGATTLLSKDRRIFKEEYNNYYSPIRIFVPSKTSTIDDLTIVFVDDLPRDFAITVIENNPATTDVIDTWQDLIATITITGPATVNPDEAVDLNVTCSDPSVTEIFVEPVVGATNKTRIIMENGQGNLKVNTFGLSSGDEINIKFGYKYFTGISRYTKTLS